MFRLLFVFTLISPLWAGPMGTAQIPLPADLEGSLNGATYKIRVPGNWNGTLLVFAHGIQVQQGAAEIAPVAWPTASPTLEERLLSLGYALAGSGYLNSDKDGVHQTLALTNFFKGKVGNPSRTIVWGDSHGGLVTLKLLEEHPGAFDGGIANCATAAGKPENMDAALAFSLAYAAGFGWPDSSWGPIGDLRDDLDFFTDVKPYVAWPTGPSDGRWEFIRLIMRLPMQAFYSKDPLTNSFFFGLGMWKATGQRAAAEAELGGPVAENVGFEYTLDGGDVAHLNTLGVDANGLLAFMNSHNNIEARRSARNHAEQWGGLDGRLRRPALTMHSIFDGLAPVYNEIAYRQAVVDAGASDQLVQVFVTNTCHCSFSVEQYLSVVTAIDNWIETGTPADPSAIPGANPGYTPPEWPF